VLDTVRAFRATDARTPVVLMGYLNPVEIRGAARFAEDAARQAWMASARRLPPEEAGELRTPAAHGLALILLASPTTPGPRLRRLCEDAQGYLYFVSFAGVTGADRLDANAAAERLQVLRAASAVPVLAGFGIKDAPPPRPWPRMPTASS
jgi:tryptophan synthase alpha chain